MSLMSDLQATEQKLLHDLRVMRRLQRRHDGKAVPADGLTLGQRIADTVAATMGSWNFIIIQSAILAVWIVANLLAVVKHWDPYPFILLNLLLSCIAAIQAPIIMMSQRRQESKDRLRSFNDYRVNLKAELEVRHLHEKLDYLISRQWTRLAEMQQMQLDAMHELTGAKKPKRATRGVRRRVMKGEAAG